MVRLWMIRAALAAALASGACGCALSPSGTLTFFPEDHPLTPAAKSVAQAKAPLDLPRELEMRPLRPYVIESGDTVLAEVEPDEEELIVVPGDQVVLPDGTIDLGIYGQAQVAGLTVREAEQAVKDKLGKDVKYKGVSVRVTGRTSKRFYVLGEVISPGSYPLTGSETVLDALIAAGGLGDRADAEQIILTRPSGPCSPRIVLPVCYDDIVQLGDTATNYQLAPGDRVFVASRSVFGGMMSRHRDEPELPRPCGRLHHRESIPAKLCPPLAAGTCPAP